MQPERRYARTSSCERGYLCRPGRGCRSDRNVHVPGAVSPVDAGCTAPFTYRSRATALFASSPNGYEARNSTPRLESKGLAMHGEMLCRSVIERKKAVLLAAPQAFVASPQAFVASPQAFVASPQAFVAAPQAFDAGPQPFDAAPQPFDAWSKPFDAALKPFNAWPKPFNAWPKPFDAWLQPLDAAPQPFTASPRAFTRGTQHYDAWTEPIRAFARASFRTLPS